MDLKKYVFDYFLTIKVSKVYYVKNVGFDQSEKFRIRIQNTGWLDANCSTVQMKGRVSSKQIACMYVCGRWECWSVPMKNALDFCSRVL